MNREEFDSLKPGDEVIHISKNVYIVETTSSTLSDSCYIWVKTNSGGKVYDDYIFFELTNKTKFNNKLKDLINE